MDRSFPSTFGKARASEVAAVATGRYGYDELAETNPDVTLQDLHRN